MARFVADESAVPSLLAAPGAPIVMAVGLKTWTESLEHAAIEVAELALGFEGSTVLANGAAPAVGGAYLPLFGGNGDSMYIGWLATEEARAKLARGLLGLGDAEDVPAA